MSVIDEIKARIDIVELIGEYVPLQKAGRNYKALCPFHTETQPSFVVYPTGSWRCYGACGEGGDVIEFVRRAEHVDFRGALELLARRAGIELARPAPELEGARSAQERLSAAVAEAVALYHDLLLRSPGAELARRYLKGRQLWGDAVQMFELGYAPPRASGLAQRLQAAGFSEEEAVTAGLVKRREDGRLQDVFYSRLLFPICDEHGRPVGFGARTLDPKGVPKYLNTAQSPIFDKKRLLYGLHRAAPAIRRLGAAVVVEGYTDVIRAHVAGFENVVASLGTALTAEHVTLIKRYAPALILALDADAAGQAATLRGLEVAREAGAEGLIPVPTGQGWIQWEPRIDLSIRVATLPQGLDPDDVIRDQPDVWSDLIRDSRPLMEYLFVTLLQDLQLSDPEHRTEATRRLLPIVAVVPDPVARSAWLARLAEILRIDERVLNSRLAEYRRSRPKGRDHASDPGPGVDKPAAPRDTAAWLLARLLCEPSIIVGVDELLSRLDQPGLEPADVDRATDRDLLVAVRYAAIGAVPPDAPEEHRLDALPEPLAEYASDLRSWAESIPVHDLAECCWSLCVDVLRLRKDRLNRDLEGLRYLLAQAAADSPELNARAVQLARQRAVIEQHLLQQRRALARHSGLPSGATRLGS